MGLEHFNPLLRANDLVQDLKWDDELRARFETSEEEVLSSYPITEDEREAIRGRDFRRLYELGLHPYLLSQLARLIYGTGEKAGTSAAATALIQSLLGDDYERYMAARE
ncbi:protocatechuate 4,5-dioxygenase, alpha chain [Micromonospora coriariae]|uniref:Protocatechuate 4,5-dioxygenase, alpha chain n=1 Tax=Micromonospora coriariae TaxID=285665 RepID=A0A1C4X451_9ACTN|nr:extradiol ring-cleavage dioxygenase [Micromonospora coriariae]SCF03202.1 protocatechuate 4,5-dioxygenase, alpha chain [Micromonospora coriariae]